MSLRAKIYNTWMKKRPKNISPMKIVALTFALIIFLGATLLNLPIASRSGVSCGFRPALFTATSATCVTGLVLFDTFIQLSGFGQVVILCLIQIGGLGFMSAATLIVFLLRKRIGLKQRLVMAQALSLNDIEGVVRLQKTVISGSFTIEGLGAAILLFRFWPEYGFWNGLKWGIFHAVSAFCNAGFDIFGCLSPGSSLMEFQSDPVVLLTLGSLIVVGGLGFLSHALRCMCVPIWLRLTNLFGCQVISGCLIPIAVGICFMAIIVSCMRRIILLYAYVDSH